MNNTILKHMNLVGACNTSEKYECVSWDDYSIPNGKSTKFHGSSHHQPGIVQVLSLKPPLPSLKTPANPPILAATRWHFTRRWHWSLQHQQGSAGPWRTSSQRRKLSSTLEIHINNGPNKVVPPPVINC